MMFSKVTTAMALALSLAVPGVASATVYDFTATGIGVNVSALVTTGAADGAGFDVTTITGSFNGVTIAGLSGFGRSDNVLFPASSSFSNSGLVDGDGLSFSLSSSNSENIFASSTGIGLPTLYSAFGTNLEQTLVTLTVTPVASAVPEPASMAVVGAGLIGLTFFRRRKHH